MSSIIGQVTREIDGVLADSDLSDDERDKTREDLIANTERILDACSIDELQSETAFERYVENCVRDAEIRVRQLHLNEKETA